MFPLYLLMLSTVSRLVYIPNINFAFEFFFLYIFFYFIENLELKKLVYLYLINYAKTQPELALLAVNTFVRDANDPVSLSSLFHLLSNIPYSHLSP